MAVFKLNKFRFLGKSGEVWGSQGKFREARKYGEVGKSREVKASMGK